MTDSERYGLRWAGKAAAIEAAATPSTCTAEPLPEASVGFDRTANRLIEGDNLDALKLLQATHAGAVKLIYIDPPFNTGQQFLYSDDYRDHSAWLSMMYPRLVLARRLLAEDGVMFVSIGDDEIHNLRHLMDEVFGPESFIATVIWQKVYAPKNSAKHFSEDHDYILVYARDASTWRPELLPRTPQMEARYRNRDDDPRGPWKPGDLSARNSYSLGTYAITCPSGRVIDGPPSGTYWRVSEHKLRELDADGRIWWGPDGDNTPAIKRFLSEVKPGRVPQTLWTYDEVGHTQEGKKELLARVEFASSRTVFDTPKPTRLIERMLRIGTRPTSGDVVLDFFAGSGTTGEAVMKLNREDGGNRRFILVQRPDPTGADDHPAISDITRARLRAAGRALSEVEPTQLDLGTTPLDLGFRVERLHPGG